jgi:hypothetical protein
VPQTHRSIFWLLLAATVCIDAVAFSRTQRTASETSLPVDIYLRVVCDALLASQMSVICIWATLAFKKALWLPALVAALTAAFVAVMFRDSSETLWNAWRLYLSLYGLEAALLLAALWLLRGSDFWQRRTGAKSGWRFSLANLLVVMTIVAVLISMLRTGPFADESKWLNIGFACSVVAMACTSAVVWSFPWHWFLRFATTLVIALVLGELVNVFAQFGSSAFPTFEAHYLVQAIMLSAWLGWGPILPQTNAADRGNNSHSAPQLL